MIFLEIVIVKYTVKRSNIEKSLEDNVADNGISNRVGMAIILDKKR